MRVILRDNIENLGKKGDIVDVASGYGRNYLIPKKIAIEVTSRNMKMIEIEQKALQKGFEKEKASYQDLIDRLNAVTLSFIRKTSEKDVIFGSVSSTDIRDALAVQGFDVEKRKILLDEPIKRLGNYTVPIKIFHEERAEVKLEVVKEGEPSAQEEKKPEQDLVEEGAVTSVTEEEEAQLSRTEEAEEDIKDRPSETETEPESTPVQEASPKDQKEIREETKEISREPVTSEPLVGLEDDMSEKETTEEPSIKETESAPSDKHVEPLDVRETEPEEKPEESEAAEEEAGSLEEPVGGAQDIPGISEKTKEDSKKAVRAAEETEETEAEKNSQEASGKDNK